MKEQKTFNTLREAKEYVDSLPSPPYASDGIAGVDNVVITKKNSIIEFSRRSNLGERNFYEQGHGLWSYFMPIVNFRREIQETLFSLWDYPLQFYIIEFNVPSPFLDFHKIERVTIK